MTLMQVAAACGRHKIVRLLANRGSNVNEVNDIGESPLHMATKNNKLDAMRTLIDLGADINAQIVTVGHSPMHYACMYGLKEASMMLLEAGADAHMPNTTALGRTPLETAKDSGYRPLFNLLLDAETTLREEREEREIMEEMSTSKKHEKLVEKLAATKKQNVTLNKTLKQRRIEAEELTRDHTLRMEQEKKNAIARRKSRAAVKDKKASKGLGAGGSSSRGSSRGGGSRGNSRGESKSESKEEFEMDSLTSLSFSDFNTQGDSLISEEKYSVE